MLRVVLLVAMLLFCARSAAISQTPVENTIRLETRPPFGQDIDQCHVQPYLSWCDDIENVAIPKRELGLQEILDISNKAKNLLSKKDDPDHLDIWRDHSEAVLSDLSYYGDCDDLASTVAELLVRAGMPEERVARAIVDTQRGDEASYDHMVVVVLIGKDELWVVGDTLMGSRPIEFVGYDIVMMSAVSDGNTWQFEVRG